MKKILTLAAALLVFGASASMAQGGLNLYWLDCSVGGAINQNFTCTSNTGTPYQMIASVYPAAPMAHFAAATAVIDITVNAPTLPAWWQTATGQCRQNVIAMSFDPNLNVSSCGDLWQFSTVVGVSAIQQGLHGPSSVRVNGVGAIPAGSEIAIAPGTEQWLCRVTIARANTVGTCNDGCTAPASIVFNETALQSPDEPKQTITAVADNYCIGANGGASVCPGATPALNRTWGAVKNLYR